MWLSASKTIFMCYFRKGLKLCWKNQLYRWTKEVFSKFLNSNVNFIIKTSLCRVFIVFYVRPCQTVYSKPYRLHCSKYFTTKDLVAALRPLSHSDIWNYIHPIKRKQKVCMAIHWHRYVWSVLVFNQCVFAGDNLNKLWSQKLSSNLFILTCIILNGLSLKDSCMCFIILFSTDWESFLSAHVPVLQAGEAKHSAGEAASACRAPGRACAYSGYFD